jgi:DNA-binding NarL/FixJ family response regulator
VEPLMDKIKVMIVDDHSMVREGLKQLLGMDDNIEIIAEANNGLKCLQLMERFHPDIIFMDIKMPGISGIETTRLVCQKYPKVKVIMLTIYDEDQYVIEAIQAGAKGYVLKKIERDELIKITHHVMKEGTFLDSPIVKGIFNYLKFNYLKKDKKDFQEDAEEQLTQRELEILKGIVEGLTDRSIGESLFISEHTVRSHIKSLYRKLRVSSKAQAVARAIQKKMINIDGRK